MVDLDHNEIYLLAEMMRERIRYCATVGLGPDDPSSLFRQGILDKLMSAWCEDMQRRDDIRAPFNSTWGHT